MQSPCVYRCLLISDDVIKMCEMFYREHGKYWTKRRWNNRKNGDVIYRPGEKKKTREKLHFSYKIFHSFALWICFCFLFANYNYHPLSPLSSLKWLAMVPFAQLMMWNASNFCKLFGENSCFAIFSRQLFFNSLFFICKLWWLMH
jgi:hypothetical protein